MKWLEWKVVVKDGKWFVNARDITDIKEVEKIRNYLATVVKQSDDAIYIHDNEGKIISWNDGAEKIYGYTENEALRMKLWNIIPEHMQPEIEEIVSSVLAGEKIHALQTKRVTKHGKIIDVSLSASVITDPASDQKSIAITERDITQQKKADEQIRHLNNDLQTNNAQLELANKELESFSYSVSHDLRAPLRAIRGYTKILLEDYTTNFEEDAIKMMNSVAGNAERMSQLIDDLLQFSRMGKKELNFAELDMNEVAKTSLEAVKMTHHNNIKAEIVMHELLPARGDSSLIENVFINLISNAIKYSSKSATPLVEINSFTKNGENIYYVKDNGVGFDMKYYDKLFGVFQRLHSMAEFEGTGVGLALVKRIITRHGGRVWAEAEPGNGATFYITLQSTNN